SRWPGTPARASIARASASRARGLASEVTRNVSPGSISFNRNFFPFVIRKLLASLCAFLMIFLVFIISPVRASTALDHAPAVCYCQILVTDADGLPLSNPSWSAMAPLYGERGQRAC